MGISYSLRLVVGFEFSQQQLESVILKSRPSKEDGIFHMEDRFDPKTGAKVAAEKVWDKKPKTHIEKWYEIDGVKYDENICPEELISILEGYFSCYVEQFGSYCSGQFSFAFYVNEPLGYKNATDTGAYTIYNDSIRLNDLNNLQSKLEKLKIKLESAGLKPGDAKVFVAQSCG